MEEFMEVQEPLFMGNTTEENKEIVRRLAERKYDPARFGHVYLQYKAAYDELVEQERDRVYRESMFNLMKDCVLREWETQVVEELFIQQERHILWIVEPDGSSGKTWLARYLLYVHDFVLLDGYVTPETAVKKIPHRPTGIVLDLTKDQVKKLNYSMLDGLKNGHVLTHYFDVCPVLVLSSKMPRKKQISRDRLMISVYLSAVNAPDPVNTDRMNRLYPPINKWAAK